MAYARRSTHFLDEQNNYRQYGIDIRFNERSHPQALLPVGKTHLLFGRINRELIYIKMEDYGVCWDQLAQHGGEYVVSKIRNSGDFLSPNVCSNHHELGRVLYWH